MLCLVFLFASLSPSKFVPASRVAACARLRTEFLAYVAQMRALRYSFVSIKGIYYQAEIQGVPLTWIEPHHRFAQQPTMIVDYRVMLSFLELYEAVLTFVNFKLYHDLGLTYPPPVDASADGAGVHLGATILTKAVPAVIQPRAPLAVSSSSSGSGSTSAAGVAPSDSQLAELRDKLSGLDRESEAAKADASGLTATDAPEDVVEADAPSAHPDVAALRELFASCYFYCGRCGPPVHSRSIAPRAITLAFPRRLLERARLPPDCSFGMLCADHSCNMSPPSQRDADSRSRACGPVVRWPCRLGR